MLSYVLLGYLILSYCFTVIFRESNETYLCRLDLFWGYEGVVDGNGLLLEHLLNILFFIPIGFMLNAILKKRLMLYSILFGLGFSLLIEASQYIFKKGTFDIDDLFNNTLGAFVGYLLFFLIKYYLHVKTDEFKHSGV